MVQWWGELYWGYGERDEGEGQRQESKHQAGVHEERDAVSLGLPRDGVLVPRRCACLSCVWPSFGSVCRASVCLNNLHCAPQIGVFVKNVSLN